MSSAPPQSPRALDPLPPLERHLNLEMDRPAFLLGGQAYLAELGGWLRANSQRGQQSATLAAYSEGHDRLFVKAWEFAAAQWKREHKSEPPAVAILAVGGYGNRGLCFRSDVDLLILMERHAPEIEPFVKALMLILIDFKLNLGYITRTVADCEAKVGTDVESVTSMTSGRLVAGSGALFEDFAKRMREAIGGRGRRWFLKTVYDEWKARRLKYESTVYLLQPNLKEGQGGLRDVDTLHWILFGLHGSVDLRQLGKLSSFDEATLDGLFGAIGFVQTLRNELHLMASTAGDLLLFDAMPEIAGRLGYEADALRSAEELMMADYYSHARVIDRCCSRAVTLLLRTEKSLLGELAHAVKRRRVEKVFFVQDHILYLDPKHEEGYFESDTTRVMDLFHRAARWGLRISDRTLERLARVAETLGPAFRLEPINHRHFMGILKQGATAATTLLDMHECRVLGHFMPEFDRIRCMVRIDHYHHYTVDEHTLKAIENAGRLREEPVTARTAAGNIARQIKRWDLLNLALLLHDVGKGFGRGHALRGGAIAQRVCERMGLPEDDIDLVRFLVLSHLKLNHAAQRRDITDPDVARQLAEEIGSLERLKMLTVLTVCDLMAVSPDAWSDWKGQLLNETFLRTAELLGAKGVVRRTGAPNRADVRARVMTELVAEVGSVGGIPRDRVALGEELDAFFRDVSDYYLRTLSPDVIARHCILRRELNDQNMLAWQLHNPQPGAPVEAGHYRAADPRFSQLTVMASDVPGLFSAICGALAAKGINIWSAQIFSTRDGYAINQFLVTDLENRPLPEGMRLDRLRADLNPVIQGEMEIDELVEKHKTRQPKRARPRAVRPTSVLFDNASSDRYTILEIRTADRPGLLFRITRAMSAAHLDIHRSIITTEAYGVVDVFYVTDMEYNKIHSELDQGKIRDALIAAIDEE